MSVDQSLARIADLAPTVAGAHAEQIAAIADEQDAEAAILDRALHLAAPAGRALASQIETAYRISGAGTSRHDTRHWHARGVVLLGPAAPSAAREHGGYRDVSDEALIWIPYSQTATVDHRPVDPYDDRPEPRHVDLLPGLYEVTWRGSISHWQGSTSGHGSIWKRRTSREIMTEYDLGKCLASLVDALEKQATAARPTKAAIERAAKLRAVLALI